MDSPVLRVNNNLTPVNPPAGSVPVGLQERAGVEELDKPVPARAAFRVADDVREHDFAVAAEFLFQVFIGDLIVLFKIPSARRLSSCAGRPICSWSCFVPVAASAGIPPFSDEGARECGFPTPALYGPW